MEHDLNKLSISDPSSISSSAYPLIDGGSYTEDALVTKVTNDQGSGSNHFSSDEDEETRIDEGNA